MTTTFIVSQKANETRAREPLRVWDKNWTVSKGVAKIVNGDEPEACGVNLPNTVQVDSNAFIEALTMSYAEHYPLAISPDDVWMVLAQSFAQHVDQNAEKLRHMFVQHEGKVLLVWRNDSLVMGSPDNPWMDGFDFFADEIKKHIGKKHDLLTANFSTTGLIEKAASQVVLMDAMKHYFEYGVMTCCGMPEITLLGTTDDWKSIRTRVQAFAEFEGLETWTRTLDPILGEFVAASEGRVNVPFWNDMYKYDHMGSGGPLVSGWANSFFLYLQGSKGLKLNPYASKPDARYSPLSNEYPSGISKVPFTWTYHGGEYPYEFLAGFFAVSQDQETLTVRPAMGWAVRATSSS